MSPKRWERIIVKCRKSYIEGGSKLVGKRGQFSMGIFKNIEQSKNDLIFDIDWCNTYKSNMEIIDKHPNYQPTTIKNAKRLGIFGKSSSELKSFIGIKENELNSIKSKEQQLKLNINNEKKCLEGNNVQDLKNKENISLNYERIEEIDCILNSIDIKKIEKIDEKTMESLRKNELISNIKEVRESIEDNNKQLIESRKNKLLKDKQLNEINIILGSSDLAKCQTYSEAYVNQK